MSAIRQIAAERKIDPDEIINAIRDAIKMGYKREYNLDDSDPLEVEMDATGGTIVVYAKKTVVKKISDAKLEISVSDAKEIDSKLKEGDQVLVDITPEGDFGRIAAQTARQVILQKLRESEKESAINEIKDKMGGIQSVVVQRILPNGDILCELNRARAIMAKAERVPTEYYQLGSRIKVLLKSIEEDVRGKFILVSRADENFLKELFRIEVPEIDSGTVEIVSIARDPGSRSKVAVRSNSDGVDPIGSCIGQKGVRINAIMNELKLGKIEEKVDVILWEEDIQTYLMNAIQPALALGVSIVDERAKDVQVLVPADQHSLAIGKEGQNARLASKLTGWNIDIVSEQGEERKEEENEDGATEETLNDSLEDAAVTEEKAPEVKKKATKKAAKVKAEAKPKKAIKSKKK